MIDDSDGRTTPVIYRLPLAPGFLCTTKRLLLSLSFFLSIYLSSSLILFPHCSELTTLFLSHWGFLCFPISLFYSQLPHVSLSILHGVNPKWLHQKLTRVKAKMSCDIWKVTLTHITGVKFSSGLFGAQISPSIATVSDILSSRNIAGRSQNCSDCNSEWTYIKLINGSRCIGRFHPRWLPMPLTPTIIIIKKSSSLSTQRMIKYCIYSMWSIKHNVLVVTWN